MDCPEFFRDSFNQAVISNATSEIFCHQDDLELINRSELPTSDKPLLGLEAGAWFSPQTDGVNAPPSDGSTGGIFGPQLKGVWPGRPLPVNRGSWLCGTWDQTHGPWSSKSPTPDRPPTSQDRRRRLQDHLVGVAPHRPAVG